MWKGFVVEKVEVIMERLNKEQAMEILRKKGIEISIEQAAAILEIMRLFADIVVADFLKENEEVDKRD